MAQFTLVVGLILVVLGLGAYFGTGRTSATALIPSMVGLLLAIFGAMARNPARRKTAMHIAVAVALIAFLGSIRGLPALMSLLSGSEVERPVAAVVQVITALLTLLVVAGGVRSFVQARRGG